MSKKLSSTFTVALIIVSLGIYLLVRDYLTQKINTQTDSTITAITGDIPDLPPSQNSYKYIKPNRISKHELESVDLSELKKKLISHIEGLKKSNKINSASIHLDILENSTYLAINPDEKYTPGSMLKVLNLIFYLKVNEQNPGILNNLIYNDIPASSIQTQTFNSKQIEESKSYSIRDLLTYMIAYSDNRATTLLKRSIDYKAFQQMLNELKITLPKDESDYKFMTAAQYSHIFKILYNSTYLSPENSELAMEILSTCDFNLGIQKGIPDSIALAHKFGESTVNKESQLHECGMVYLNLNPYLITIMTTGKNVKELPNVIAGISKLIYAELSTENSKK